ncbi:hypothetical protein GGS21DRAFT_525315 [Xylaria nigripes]|nr:hypothetical protein GGS21DRAFT_525315 [Xylaria nigripes]
MLEKLVERIMPGSYTVSPRVTQNASSASADAIDPDSADNECPFDSIVKPPILKILTPLRDKSKPPITDCHSDNLSMSESNQHEPTVLSHKYENFSKALHGLFPCQKDIDTITASSSGSWLVSMLFVQSRDIAEGRTEDPTSVRNVPNIGSHPVVLARRLMQLTHCIQQLQPSISDKLALKTPTRCLMAKYVSAVLDLVAYNDDLVGYSEGIEMLALIAIYHSNAGNLRKSWLISRRALSIAQLMGVDRYGDKPLKSADPTSNPLTRPRAKVVWFCLNFIDRYLSLTLGLPAGVDDNSFLAHEAGDSAKERLEKQHAVIMGAIIKRNSSKGVTCLNTTRAIDSELEKAARSVPSDFWKCPSAGAPKNADPKDFFCVIMQMMLQVHHHNLLILLHLPYMLRDPKERRWDYSKATCVSSSRQLLRTFLMLREMSKSSFMFRPTDYSALTASMTLLLGYLDPKLQAQDPATTSDRAADRTLIQSARDKLLQIAEQNDDKVARDAAGIIGRLLPLLDPDLMANAGQGGRNEHAGEAPVIQLEIPYVGTIHINPNMSANTDYPRHDTPRQAMPTSTTTISTTNTTTKSHVHPATSTAATNPMTPPNAVLTRHNYLSVPQFPALSHYPTSWATPSNQQGFKPIEGSEQAEASDLLPLPLDYGSAESTCINDFMPTMQFRWSQAELAHSELAAEADEWTFQGFDTAYFESVFSSNATYS